MKNTIADKIVSFNASLAVADQPDNQPLWQNQPPLAFNDGLGVARASVTALVQAAAKQSIKTTGATGALRGLRTQFEKSLHPIARATFQCLTKLGRTEDAAKVDLSPTDLHDARAIALAGLGETVLELAEPLSKSPAAGQPASGAAYGLTDATVAATDDLWHRFSTAVGAPGGARSARKAKTNALPVQTAAVEAQFAVLDDLIVQFNATPAGQHFVDAWFNARRVIDTGRRANKPAPPAPQQPPATPGK